MIKSLNVVNLNRRMNFNLIFNEDINIITGKNGSGKTTLLKLLWYAISGNLERILPEISFDSFDVVTDSMALGMTVETRQKRKFIKLRYRIGDLDKDSDRPIERAGDWSELEEANRAIIRLSGPSVFFPTFRRIEGGFSIAQRHNDDVVRYSRERSFINVPMRLCTVRVTSRAFNKQLIASRNGLASGTPIRRIDFDG